MLIVHRSRFCFGLYLPFFYEPSGEPRKPTGTLLSQFSQILNFVAQGTAERE